VRAEYSYKLVAVVSTGKTKIMKKEAIKNGYEHKGALRHKRGKGPSNR
jgi:UDP-N-acetylglucosamine enolpyruvyl transferase